MDADTLFGIYMFAGLLAAAFNLWFIVRVITFMSNVEAKLERLAPAEPKKS